MNYQKYAWLCIWLSLEAEPSLRDMLMRFARIWVRASIRNEGSQSSRGGGV
jgi:hypothetical protein